MVVWCHWKMLLDSYCCILYATQLRIAMHCKCEAKWRHVETHVLLIRKENHFINGEKEKNYKKVTVISTIFWCGWGKRFPIASVNKFLLLLYFFYIYDCKVMWCSMILQIGSFEIQLNEGNGRQVLRRWKENVGNGISFLNWGRAMRNFILIGKDFAFATYLLYLGLDWCLEGCQH